MLKDLKIYNTLSKKKELFEPIKPPFVGMYVCGPTVYSDVHLGNVRTFLSFDILFRYLRHLGYKVRYVRNITDVGHLENDADEGEDKIAKKAKLEDLEPMEIVHRYTNGFHQVLHQFNILSPSIEPTATGHIQEQIAFTQKLLDAGAAYEVNGSVYFDVSKYTEKNHYGKLSGRVLEDQMATERALDGQDEKRNKVDFALWKKAATGHIMQWDSPWGKGFPGWHLECTVMSTKYLGDTFDIHGGGMDLKFPHHECEIAQSVASTNTEPARYWMHTNMLTVNGQKMSKSLGNSFLPEELFSGNHPLLEQAFSPMTVRFFMLQSHYSSTLDFSNEALVAARKGYRKLVNGLSIIKGMAYEAKEEIAVDEKVSKQVAQLSQNCYRAMNDDLNTALTIGHLFNIVKKINALHTGGLEAAALGKEVFEAMKHTFIVFVEQVLGLKEESTFDGKGLINAMLSIYKSAKEQKDYEKVDEIRAVLKEQGVRIKDMKTSIDWQYEE